MNRFTKNTKLATALAAALMISAPVVFAPTAGFAASYSQNNRHDTNTRNKTQQSNARHDNNRYDNARHDNARHSNARRDNAKQARKFKARYNKRHYNPMRDRAHRPALRHERRGYAPHRGWKYHQGHWNWQRDQWIWIAGIWLNR